MFGKKPSVPTPEDAKQQIQEAIEAAGLNGRISALTLQDRNVALAVGGLTSDQQATCQQAIEGLKWTEKGTIHISSSTPDSPAPEPEAPAATEASSASILSIAWRSCAVT